MSTNKDKGGFFENFLMFIGGWTGFIIGYGDENLGGAVIGLIIFGAIGKWIGAVADQTVKLIALVILILLNGFIRRLLWSIILKILQVE